MPSQTVLLDLRCLPPDQQVDRLKEQYRLLRGNDAMVRAQVGALPVRQYISMLERGYRVGLERDGEECLLVLRSNERFTAADPIGSWSNR